jgi:hypothetical protein
MLRLQMRFMWLVLELFLTWMIVECEPHIDISNIFDLLHEQYCVLILIGSLQLFAYQIVRGGVLQYIVSCLLQINSGFRKLHFLRSDLDPLFFEVNVVFSWFVAQCFLRYQFLKLLDGTFLLLPHTCSLRFQLVHERSELVLHPVNLC